MLPRGSRRSLWGWLALLVLLLLGAAMTAADQENAGGQEPPPAPVDWSKTAKSTGQAKLNRYSKWVQYVVGGEVFYVKGDDWTTRRDDPPPEGVKEKGKGQDRRMPGKQDL